MNQQHIDYSLIIIKEVIFGYAPFTSNSFDELEKKILADTPIQVCLIISINDSKKTNNSLTILRFQVMFF
jgi:hypothetical protein